MVNATSIQNKITTKIFNGLGSTATRYPYASAVEDKWGDGTTTYSASESITVVPYGYINKKANFQPFGNVQAGSLLMAIQYEQSMDEKDKITYDNKTLFVRQIEKFPLQNALLVKVIELVEELN